MRGKVCLSSLAASAIGITPAYAGKSSKQSGDPLKLWDHPRLCGEKYPACHDLTTLKGSPPPMRGKAQSLPAEPDKSQDHPRLCGEKV